MQLRELIKFLLVISASVSVVLATHQGVYDSRCPPAANIAPCHCSERQESSDGKLTFMDCSSEVDLPRLTYILRNASCGRRLHEFELTSSGIGYLPSNLFSKVAVSNIKISSTNISHFTEAGISTFYGLEGHLKTLSMRRCRLVDGLNWEKIGEIDALQTLDLSMNDLTTIPKQWFKHPPRNLRSLHVRGNRITHLQPGALSAMNNLVMVDLSENQIASVQRNMFPYPGNSLAILYLSYNHLEKLPKDFFDELFGMRKLYLDHNQLRTLVEDVWLPIWGELDELDVSDNNINCDCGVKWITFLKEIDHLYGDCGEGNTELQKQTLKSLDYTKFDELNCTYSSREL